MIAMRDLMMVLHFIGLAMAIGAGFANLFLGMVASKLEPAERTSFMSRIMILGIMGRSGLGLLVLSGFGLATPYWQTLGEMPLFIVKLSTVAILLISVSFALFLIAKAKNEINPAILAKLKPLGMLNLLLGITIIVLAVLTFH